MAVDLRVVAGLFDACGFGPGVSIGDVVPFHDSLKFLEEVGHLISTVEVRSCHNLYQRCPTTVKIEVGFSIHVDSLGSIVFDMCLLDLHGMKLCVATIPKAK